MGQGASLCYYCHTQAHVHCFHGCFPAKPVFSHLLSWCSSSFHSRGSTHTHTQPFYGSLDFVQDNRCEPVLEGTFRHLLDFLEQNEDNTGWCTNNLDGLPPIQTNWCPHLCHPHHLYAGCPSLHNPPNLSWLGTGTKHAGLHTRWHGSRSSTLWIIGTDVFFRPDVLHVTKPLSKHFW